MTKYTPLLKLPYPEAADAPKGDQQIQALAERVEGLFGSGQVAVLSGSADRMGTAQQWARLMVANTDTPLLLGGWTFDEPNGALVCPASGMYVIGFDFTCFGANEGDTAGIIAANATGSGDPSDKTLIDGYGNWRRTACARPVALTEGDSLSLWGFPYGLVRDVASAWMWAVRLGDAPPPTRTYHAPH